MGVGSYVGTEGWRGGERKSARNGAATAGGRANGYSAEATSQDGIIEMERRDGARERSEGVAADEPVYAPPAQGAHAV